MNVVRVTAPTRLLARWTQYSVSGVPFHAIETRANPPTIEPDPVSRSSETVSACVPPAPALSVTLSRISYVPNSLKTLRT